MESWKFHHPTHGLYEVQLGYDKEFAHEYPDWPVKAEQIRDFEPVPVHAGWIRRLRLWRANPPRRVQILHESQPVLRLERVPQGRQSLEPQDVDQLHSPMGAVPGKPMLVFQRTKDSQVLSLTYKEAQELVECDPPPGSRGEKYLRALRSSRLKRFIYPVVLGLGKSFWAIFLLVIMPILGKYLDPLIEWFLSFLPDFPALPSPPEIWIPIPYFPDIWLPTFELPQWQVPAWVSAVMEYRRIWLPLLLGIGAGVTALRNHRKSEEFKRKRQLAAPDQSSENSAPR
ncbi:hypothetical protein GP475_11775 [Corynebacterium poyangense]|uniref:Uncharacterized protein n=1 Tax=Corynebacterium poyangense TaxID=2684405 RepID=A0A7H0SRR0_9CORY|nr:hypothetical protein [Corynebacterium poyangense]MBZ8176669.1 hypothetical protein [Corynebacterium poyangense]QNQ91235.1 hypothetical protein GP475_11775 [Corynebacterium poyangense]